MHKPKVQCHQKCIIVKCMLCYSNCCIYVVILCVTFYYTCQFQTSSSDLTVVGIGNSRLNFFTNILSSAGVSVGNSGTYRCAICKRNDTIDHCRHRNITVFVLGEAPILDVSRRKPERKLLKSNHRVKF